MPIKETPLFKAAERTGPLPSFLFSNPIVAGVFAMMMSAVCGAFFAVFQVAGYGTVDMLDLYEAIKWGAIIAMWVAVPIFLSIIIIGSSDPDESNYRVLFVVGGGVGVALLMFIDQRTHAFLSNWFSTLGPLV